MPLTADVATFRQLFPEFDSVDTDTVEFYLDWYSEDLSPSYWNNTLGEAVLYVSAHEIALSQNRQANAVTTEDDFVTTSSSAGPITSASAAGISAGFSPTSTATQGSDADTYFMRTEYGQHFLFLKRTFMPLGILAV